MAVAAIVFPTLVVALEAGLLLNFLVTLPVAVLVWRELSLRPEEFWGEAPWGPAAPARSRG